MNRFRFRFDTIIRLRKLREELQQKKFAAQQEKLINEQHKLNEIKKQQRHLIQETLKKLSGYLDLEVLKSSVNYSKKLESNEENQRVVLQDEKEHLEDRRKELVEAAKERSIMERLYESDFREYMKRLDYEEVLFLDDIGASAYMRKENIARQEKE